MMEVMMASFILAITVIGLYGSFNSSFYSSDTARQAALAGQLGRAEIERAKVYGMTDLPLGTYSSSTQTATWTGAYDPTANTNAGGWVSGETAYFDMYGTRLYSATNAFMSLQDTFVDSNVVASSNTYTYQLQSEKAMVVTAKLVKTGATLFTEGTNIVTGGL
jgi:Tfp pilus assembly protein PilV